MRAWQARVVTISLALGVLAILVLKLVGSDDLREHIDVPAVILVALLVLLGFIAYAPGEAKEFVGRTTSLKVAGIEVGLQAATRVERVESRVPEIDDTEVGELFDDKVKALTKRHVGGSASEEFDEVREKLKERLRYVRDVVLELPAKAKPLEIIHEINEKGLLEPDEAKVVRDLLGDAEKQVVLLDANVRRRYLDGGWRFASRFATLVHERNVRQALVDQKWLLLDIDQTSRHRPDFLAFREQVWLVATRVEPSQTKKTRGRLQRQKLPCDAERVVIYPDHRQCQAATVDKDEFKDVSLIPLAEIEKAAAEFQRTRKAPLSP